MSLTKTGFLNYVFYYILYYFLEASINALAAAQIQKAAHSWQDEFTADGKQMFQVYGRRKWSLWTGTSGKHTSLHESWASQLWIQHHCPSWKHSRHYSCCPLGSLASTDDVFPCSRQPWNLWGRDMKLPFFRACNIFQIPEKERVFLFEILIVCSIHARESKAWLAYYFQEVVDDYGW